MLRTGSVKKEPNQISREENQHPFENVPFPISASAPQEQLIRGSPSMIAYLAAIGEGARQIESSEQVPHVTSLDFRSA